MTVYSNRIKHEEFIGQEIGVVTITEFSHSIEGKDRMIYYYKYKCLCGLDGVAAKYSLLNTKIRENKTNKKTFCCKTCRKDKISEWAKTASIRYDDPVEAHFSDYRSKCKRKNWDFKLTFEEFKNLTSQNCHYCNLPPDNYRKDCSKSRVGAMRTHFSGVDRIDSSKGYIEGNCLPCCEDCNKGKRNLSYDDFLDMVKSIYEHLKLNET